MKTGILFHAHSELPLKEELTLLNKNGFSVIMFGAEQPDLDKILVEMKPYDLTCENLHAPFDDINSLWFPGDAGEKMLKQLTDSVTTCARNDIPVLVVHLSSGETPPAISDIGIDRFDRLAEAARREGVQIAFENQRVLGNIAFAMERYPDAGFCWDNGHEACFTPGRNYMPLFGSRITALHVHDNNMEYEKDLHMLPGDGKIDFDAVARQLAAAHYEKCLLLEVFRADPRYGNMTAEEYYARAGKAARKLADAVDRYR